MDLPERKRRVLKAIIENYIKTAEPVGSKAIAGSLENSVSSATIRNDMSELEELGYLEKPHVSAGRIPSNQAYRLYVNELMERYRVANDELESIRNQLSDKMRELDNIMMSASRVVSQLTNHTTVSMIAGRNRQTVRKIEIIPVDDGITYALVLVTQNNVKSHMIRLPAPVGPSTAAVLSTAFNMGIAENRLSSILPSLAMSAGEHSLIYYFAEKIFEYISESESEACDSDVYVEGAAMLLNNREYQDADRMRELLEYLSDRNRLRSLVPQTEPDRINIKIGPENSDPTLRDASFIYTTYDIDEGVHGIIGVIAPTRMDYARACAVLNAFAQSLKRDDNLTDGRKY